jgi:hypothetical protein
MNHNFIRLSTGLIKNGNKTRMGVFKVSTNKFSRCNILFCSKISKKIEEFRRSGSELETFEN